MTAREHPAPPPLPDLSDERIDEIEDALFAAIARDRTLERGRELSAARKRARRRRAVWWTTAAAAVVVVGAVAIGPSLGRLSSGAAGSAVDTGDQSAPAPESGNGFVVGADGAKGTDLGSSAGSDPDAAVAAREIIATAQATVRVDDVAAAAQAIGSAAAEHGGYVESMNVGQEGVVPTPDPAANGGVVSDTVPLPAPVTGAWVTVRLPADELTGAIDELSALGTVESSSISRQDVTEQAVDLRARIDALQASVDRLTELMAKAGSVGDLIAAESALSQRQADLESYQQQLKSLEGQVAMSSLTVSLTPAQKAVKADPAGFGDGLAAGWNGLVATLNGIVVGLGFLLPWLVVAAMVGLVVWWIVRMRRRRAASVVTGGAPESQSSEE
jgi:hypothetical protein